MWGDAWGTRDRERERVCVICVCDDSTHSPKAETKFFFLQPAAGEAFFFVVDKFLWFVGACTARDRKKTGKKTGKKQEEKKQEGLSGWLVHLFWLSSLPPLTSLRLRTSPQHHPPPPDSRTPHTPPSIHRILGPRIETIHLSFVSPEKTSQRGGADQMQGHAQRECVCVIRVGFRPVETHHAVEKSGTHSGPLTRPTSAGRPPPRRPPARPRWRRGPHPPRHRSGTPTPLAAARGSAAPRTPGGRHPHTRHT